MSGGRSLVAALLFAARVWATEEVDVEVVYRDGRVTADLHGVPLPDVLDAIQRATGAAVNGAPIHLSPVHARLEAVPLPEALRRLLGGQNFMIRYRPGGDVAGIDLLGSPQIRMSNGMAQVSPADLYNQLAAHPPVPVNAALAKAAGGDRVRVPRLLQIATQDPNADVRREAFLTVLRTVEADDLIRNIGLLALRRHGDAQLLDVVRLHGGPHAGELLGILAAEATDAYVKRRATSLRQKLAGDGATPGG